MISHQGAAILIRWFGRFLLLLFACTVGTVALAEPPRKSGAPVVPVSVTPALKSSSALVMEAESGREVYAKNTDNVMPIASITKLMTAMVVLDAGLSLTEPIVITKADRDRQKGTQSRLGIGIALTRHELLHLALMASENRAAAALSRVYPGGSAAFVAAMNRKAVELGMWQTRFVDGTGLSSENVSTAGDLGKMVIAAHGYPLIREFTTDTHATVYPAKGRPLSFHNSNRLVSSRDWRIGLSKTGYISEAGRCLVLHATIADTPVVIILLDSWGTLTRIGDANRIKRWMETSFKDDTSG